MSHAEVPESGVKRTSPLKIRSAVPSLVGGLLLGFQFWCRAQSSCEACPPSQTKVNAHASVVVTKKANNDNKTNHSTPLATVSSYDC